MLLRMFPLIAALVANLSAQIIKPVFFHRIHKVWNFDIIFASGGFPSSHTAAVTALCIAVGIVDGLDSTTFAISIILALIVCYDAANVRFYAGQNIRITQQLIKDIEDLTQTRLDDPIYMMKVKNVLGHKWVEVIGGVIWGSMITGIYYLLFLL